MQRLIASVVVAGLIAPGLALAAAPHAPGSHSVTMTAAAAAEGPAPAAASPAPAATVKPGSAKPKAKPAPSAPPEAATPLPTAAQTAKARAEFDDFAAGRIDRTHYNGYANMQISDTLVSQLSAVLKSLGTVKSFVPLPTASYQGMTVYQFVATCASGSIDELISWDGNGKIQLVYFRQPK